jgi:ABC-type bacteriocin/lantibiotic exporter with double-glycine peptidase domain
MRKKVMQRERTDCGVACTAMLLNISYKKAKELFIAAGLDIAKLRHPAFASNVGELQKVLEAGGATIKRQRFKDWETFKTPCIAKTLVRPDGNWHWVVIDYDAEVGFYVLDPCEDLPSYQYPPELIPCVTIEHYIPEGTCLTLV